MRRFLSLFITGAMTTGALFAQADKTLVNEQRPDLKKMQESLLPFDVATAEAKKDMQAVAYTSLKVSVDRVLQLREKLSRTTSVTNSSSIARSTRITAALPANLAGNKVTYASNYFDNKDVVMAGTSVQPHETDNAKVLFVNLLFNEVLESPTEFSGTVNTSAKTISIPAGQTIASYQDITSGAIIPLKLVGIKTDGETFILEGSNLTATYDDQGKVVFKEYVGVYEEGEQGGFWELFEPGMNMVNEGMVPPNAFYRRPQGMLYQGRTTAWESFYANFSYSPAHVDNVFTNLSTTPQAAFNWSVEKLISQSQTETSNYNTKDLTINGEPAQFIMPVLTATIGAQNHAYQLAPATEGYDSYYSLSGDSYSQYENGVQTTISGFTNANPAQGSVYYSVGDPDVNGDTPYMYGTGISGAGAQHSVISRYEKPLSTLYFEGVDLFLGQFVAPAKTPFTCYVVRTKVKGNSFERLDTIAYATTYTENVTMLGQGNLATMSFTNFTAITDLGLPAEVNYLEIDDEFIVEVTGFQVPNCTFAVLSEKTPLSTSAGTSYFTVQDPVKGLVTYSWQNTRAMLMNLRNAAYSYLKGVDESPVVTLDNQGSRISYKLFPMYNGIWMENDYDVPEWLTVEVDEEINQTDYSFSVHFTAAPLPANVTGRDFTAQMKTWGARQDIQVVQGVVSGMDKTTAATTKAVVTGDRIELTYQQMTTVNVVDVQGKVCASYVLDPAGKTSIPAGDLAKGVYMLQFKGANTEVVKVVK